MPYFEALGRIHAERKYESDKDISVVIETDEDQDDEDDDSDSNGNSNPSNPHSRTETRTPPRSPTLHPSARTPPETPHTPRPCDSNTQPRPVTKRIKCPRDSFPPVSPIDPKDQPPQQRLYYHGG